MMNKLILSLLTNLAEYAFPENRSLEKSIDDAVDLSISSLYGRSELSIRNLSGYVLRNVKVEKEGESNLLLYSGQYVDLGDIQPNESKSIDVLLLDQGAKKTLFNVSWEDEDGKVHSLLKCVNS